MSDRFFTALARVVVRFRWLVVALWIAVVVITSAAFPSLSSEINNDNSQFLPSSTPSSQAASLAAPILGSRDDNSTVTIVAVRTGKVSGVAALKTLARVTAAARAVARVDSARAIAISADGKAAQVLVRAHINAADITDQKTLISGLERALASAHPPPGVRLALAGAVATNVANQASSTAHRQRDADRLVHLHHRAAAVRSSARCWHR